MSPTRNWFVLRVPEVLPVSWREELDGDSQPVTIQNMQAVVAASPIEWGMNAQCMVRGFIALSRTGEGFIA